MATYFVSCALEPNTIYFSFQWTLLTCHLETSGIFNHRKLLDGDCSFPLLLGVLLLPRIQEPALTRFSKLWRLRVFVEG